MTTLTTFTRIYDESQLKQVDRVLKASFKGLDVEVEISGLAAGKWVKVSLSGEDERVAINYLVRELGLCPKSLENVKASSVLKGYVVDLEGKKQELLVDVGVFEPEIVHGILSLDRLQAQLLDYRKVTLKEATSLFGFTDNLPVNIKVIRVGKDDKRLEVEIAPAQVTLYRSWKRSLLDRLFVLGASTYQVTRALAGAKLSRDVLDIESFGMFEHALVCKFGTSATGLIPKIGRTLGRSKFSVFSPERLWKLCM
ncbi:MAG: DUF2110 family protein [Candidatus Bathyarchaeia archaeon]